MKNINKKLIILLIATVLVLTFFVGCEEETPPIQGTKAKFLAALKTETDKIAAVATVTYDGEDIEVAFESGKAKGDVIQAAFDLLDALKDDIKVKDGSKLIIGDDKEGGTEYLFDDVDLVGLANDIYDEANPGDDEVTVHYFAFVKYIDNSFWLEGDLTFTGFEEYKNP